MATTNAQPVYGDVSPLPSGLKTVTTFPDFLMLLEFVFGGLVWILVASSTLSSGSLLQGWVMFVSVTLFVCTTILLILSLVGAHGGRSTWTTLDAFYHYAASLMYLSASVIQAVATIVAKNEVFTTRFYQENIAAVVFSFLVTLVYVIHAVASLIRWKRSP
ncbi:myelin and lymphocyte protein [Bufo bufo]|uniref:myelin and lymphocyte protein n=1 Tax=Bufo bufo TaxID=8384 RepID=UPI001ABE0E9A|nr:myelin and lymphocyte protein [Bufo bufo]